MNAPADLLKANYRLHQSSPELGCNLNIKTRVYLS